MHVNSTSETILLVKQFYWRNKNWQKPEMEFFFRGPAKRTEPVRPNTKNGLNPLAALVNLFKGRIQGPPGPVAFRERPVHALPC